MDQLEIDLDKMLQNKNNERRIIDKPGDSNWGQLIVPGKNENRKKTKKGLKVMLMASYRTGYLLIKTIIEIEKKYPDHINIVGLITDDPLSKDARISMKRRIWRLMDDKKKLHIEDAILEMALSFGIPCFTGAVKTNYARKLIHYWNPDTIQVFVFGQIIDEPIIAAPKYGIYNYHPADLAHHHGAGPQPYQDLINRNASSSKFTIHQLSIDLDSGPIVGQSPPINVLNKDGNLPNNLLIIEDKMLMPMDYMAAILMRKIIATYEKKTIKHIDKIDFCSYFSENQKASLLMPIQYSKPIMKRPEISISTQKLINNMKINI